MLSVLVHYFAAVDPKCDTSHFVLGFPTWYKYLNVTFDSTTNTCSVTNFVVPGDLVLVALAIAEILLRIAGLAAVGYVIWGGIQYVTSQGEPDKTKKAQQTIMNAVIGAIIAISATAIVSFIGNKLGS